MSGTTRGGAGSRSVKRFPLYLRVLREMELNGDTYASGAVVAKALSFDPIVVRKDFAKTGVCGKPRLGFPLYDLIDAIEKFVGWQTRTDAVLAGAGRLGSALIGYPGFKEQGFQIVAAFDVKPNKNQTINGVPVYPVSQLCERVKKKKVTLGILTVPDEHAQDVADAMIAGGVRGIWNFTPVRLKVPEDVIVKREDLAASLALLSYRLHQDEDA
ncbi:MAG: redox-sensing transcriptional repressor Rex [Kiritimatiellae bacterium]|jgi:redox-sensing transcriptional repressor|nr:redox-sensing transcriptional repressor Rex [Kiritimatiellia bacterium]